ncbi:unnamed protein product [Caenorhabditis angaria]|uniref:Uncharacterized protein n=1 Tax=Caenorhabditis angaria TaxID=860376 RepID=A0A9P1INS8_9PELO|nr:unnamed protein product [Caenorhabditis angaria]
MFRITCILLVSLASAQFNGGPRGGNGGRFADGPNGFAIEQERGGFNNGPGGFNNGPRGPGGFNNGPGDGIGYNNNNQALYEAKGRLVCGLNPLNNVQVVLWDRQNGIYEQAQTDVIGGFRLRATSGNQPFIRPFLTIAHDCNDEQTPGLRKMTVQLPSGYTNQGTLALKSFDIGTWNLETVFSGEEFDTPSRSPQNFLGYFNHNFGGHQRGGPIINVA